MPVKKNKKKEHEDKPNKKSKKGKKKVLKKISKKSKKDSQEIKKAVRDLPSVLMQEMNKQTEVRGETEKINVPVSREISIPVKKKTAQIYSSPKNSSVWLWSAVIIFTLVIFILWIMSIGNLFFDNKGNSNGPLDSLQDSKGELQSIFKNFNDDKDKNTQNLKNLLTSSTLEANTTSTVNLQKLQDAMHSLFVSTTTDVNNNLTTTTKNQ